MALDDSRMRRYLKKSIFLGSKTLGQHLPISDLDVHVGRRVASRRVTCGVSTAAICAALSMDQRTLAACEAGLMRFEADALYQLCAILDVKPSWFFADYEPD
jgi:hypothetical protein